MSSAPLPDAGLNWVDRHAPDRLKPWLKLGRFDRPIGIWLLLLPGWQGITLALVSARKTPDLYDLWLYLGFALGACLMRAAGCAFNDIVDRDFDAQVARTALRPIPAGQITVKRAWAFLIACSLISLLILLTLNLTAILLGVASLALVAAYPFMKRITWWPQAWLGLTFNWGALMGFAAAASGSWSVLLSNQATVSVTFRGELSLSALLLHFALVFWTLGYDTLYALQDIEDDAMVGVKSSARRLGSRVRAGVAVFYSLAVVLAIVAGYGLRWPFYLGLIAFAAHLSWQVHRLRRDDAALALKLFKSNREAGLILLAAIALGGLS